MTDLTLPIPDHFDLALNVRPDALGAELLLAAAMKLFELGKVSAGKAAELAGLPKPVFLARLADWSVSACTLTAEDLAAEVANA